MTRGFVHKVEVVDFLGGFLEDVLHMVALRWEEWGRLFHDPICLDMPFLVGGRLLEVLMRVDEDANPVELDIHIAVVSWDSAPEEDLASRDVRVSLAQLHDAEKRRLVAQDIVRTLREFYAKHIHPLIEEQVQRVKG